MPPSSSSPTPDPVVVSILSSSHHAPTTIVFSCTSTLFPNQSFSSPSGAVNVARYVHAVPSLTKTYTDDELAGPEAPSVNAEMTATSPCIATS